LLETCECGHVFEDVRELREQLEDRVRVGWSLIALGVLALGGCIAIVFITSAKFILGLIGGSILLARGVIARGDARAQLDQIRSSTVTLPTAKVLR
jgi:hypothetical protein